jgi:Predicted signal-transduction protein containing cAMP-binding and CBS domains
MDIEALEIIDFLKSTLPLDSASSSQLDSLVKEIRIGYRKRKHILTLKPDYLYLVRKGAVLIEDENEKLFSILGERQWFGYSTQLVLYSHSCQEDTLYYKIPKKLFLSCFQSKVTFIIFSLMLD